MSPSRRSMAGAVVASVLFASCASLPIGGPHGETQARFERAVSALDRADFAAAEPDLAWLVGRCGSGSKGSASLLLLASAELDPRNPQGSPAEAARMAGAFLSLPDVPDDQLPLAEALYLLARDRTVPGEGDDEDTVVLAGRYRQCDVESAPVASRALPEPPDKTTGERIAHLEALLANRDQRLRQLESEIERIRKLLKGSGDTVGVRR